MRISKMIVLLSLSVFGLAGCTGGTGFTGFGGNNSTEPSVDISTLPSMRVVALEVDVPRELTVSEAGGYKPRADILWHGEAFGDRHEQVDKIVTEGLTRGGLTLQGDLPVSVFITVTRFHAVTSRTRYTIGGEHEIEFDIVVSNARTGEVVIPRYHIDATFPTLAGEAASQADQAGLTQKMRILDRLSRILPEELGGVSSDG